MDITSPEQLKMLLTFDLEIVFDELMDAIVKELKKQMDIAVYDAYSPSFYNRQGDSGGLRSLWEKSHVLQGAGGITAVIEEHPENLNNDPDLFIHGSNFWGDVTDITDMLSGIVIGGGSGPLFGYGAWSEPRDFWTPLIEMIEAHKFDGIIEGVLKRLGLTFEKG
jgi:hypothetical protein